jgi:hypothetical protein
MGGVSSIQSIHQVWGFSQIGPTPPATRLHSDIRDTRTKRDGVTRNPFVINDFGSTPRFV